MDYTNAIEDYVMPDDHNEKTLTKLEFKGYRGISSKLQWLVVMIRPDLSYDCLEISCHSKDAKGKDLKNAKKVLKKAKENCSELKQAQICNDQIWVIYIQGFFWFG